MNLIRRLIHDMGTFLDSIKDEIASIHSTAGIDAQVTADVHTAVDAALAPVVAAQAASETRLADLETIVKTMADQLTAGNADAALATAQAAVTPAPAAESAATA